MVELFLASIIHAQKLLHGITTQPRALHSILIQGLNPRITETKDNNELLNRTLENSCVLLGDQVRRQST